MKILFFCIFFIIFFTMLKMNNKYSICLNLMMDLNFDLIINMENLIFSLTVLLISMMVYLYSKFYFSFSMDLSYKINLFLFIISMIILIFSNNLLSLFLGWDGLGISSFFLVSFYMNKDSSISSLITFFFNRLGDSFMLLFFCLMKSNSLFLELLSFNYLILLLFFIGLITKSSQIPFGVWLPMAMSAPTPVSSLVHSSTLVTAGIFIMMKMNFIMIYKEFQMLSFIFGLMTFLLGGMFSFCIMDLKKAVAFSTLSQLGFIMFSISMGNYLISFYHLVFHAFFKSSLFMNLGMFMAFNFSLQDSRIMKKMNLNLLFKISYFLSSINLMGLISSLGFLSKDLILIYFFNSMTKIILLFMLYFGCVFTACYSIKFIMFIFVKESYQNSIYYKMKQSNYFMGFIIFSFLLISWPIFMMNFMNDNNFLFLSYSLKLMFYFIVLISYFLIKLIFIKMNFILMNYSSMMFILEYINETMKKYFFIVSLMYSKMMSMEENSQLSMMKSYFTKTMNLTITKNLFFSSWFMIFLFI